jgi:hypothetical protein
MGREFLIRTMACDLGRRLGREDGLVEGLQKGIVALLKVRFKSQGAKLARKVRAKCDLKRLQRLLRIAARAKSVDEVQSVLG